MFIVTAAAGGERSGCLVGFAAQCSIRPPQFMAWLSIRNRTHRVAARATALAVHLVPEDAVELAELFGGETGDEIDKFTRCSWREGPEGLPILDACPDWFAGRVLERAPAADHEGFLLAPFAGAATRRPRWLPFQRARDIEPGHEA